MTVTAQQCIEFASEAYGITPDSLIHGGRPMEYVWPRWVAMQLCRFYCAMSLKDIGKALQCHHSTVFSGLKELAKAIETDKHIASDVALIEMAFQKETGLTPVVPTKRRGYRMSKYSTEK